jgi:hypothetical protein
MKKLLAFVMVLSLASLANAALVLNGTNNGDGTGSVTVAIDGGSLTGCDLTVRTLSGTGTIGDGTIYDTSALGAWTPIAPVAGSDDQNRRYSGTAIIMYGGQPIPGPADIIADMPLTSVGEYVVELYVFEGGTVLDGAPLPGGQYGTFTIPEPMTMTLLGLGGLGLLRRRR